MNATLTPLDYFQALTEEEQDKLFLAMVRMVADNNPDRGVVPLRDGNALLGFFVRPGTAEAERLDPPLPPDSRCQADETLDLDDVLSMDEVRKLTAEALSEIRSRSRAGSTP